MLFLDSLNKVTSCSDDEEESESVSAPSLDDDQVSSASDLPAQSLFDDESGHNFSSSDYNKRQSLSTISETNSTASGSSRTTKRRCSINSAFEKTFSSKLVDTSPFLINVFREISASY